MDARYEFTRLGNFPEMPSARFWLDAEALNSCCRVCRKIGKAEAFRLSSSEALNPVRNAICMLCTGRPWFTWSVSSRSPLIASSLSPCSIAMRVFMAVLAVVVVASPERWLTASSSSVRRFEFRAATTSGKARLSTFALVTSVAVTYIRISLGRFTGSTRAFSTL